MPRASVQSLVHETTKRPLDTERSDRESRKRQRLYRKISALESEIRLARLELALHFPPEPFGHSSHLETAFLQSECLTPGRDGRRLSETTSMPLPLVASTQVNPNAKLPEGTHRSGATSLHAVRWARGPAQSSTPCARQRNTKNFSQYRDISRIQSTPRQANGHQTLERSQQKRLASCSQSSSPKRQKQGLARPSRMRQSRGTDVVPLIRKSKVHGLKLPSCGMESGNDDKVLTLNPSIDCRDIPPVPPVPADITGKRAQLVGGRLVEGVSSGRRGSPEESWVGWDEDVF